MLVATISMMEPNASATAEAAYVTSMAAITASPALISSVTVTVVLAT